MFAILGALSELLPAGNAPGYRMDGLGAPASSFPFGLFPPELQLTIFKRTDALTMNAVRQVDSLRRKMVDENPFFFQDTRLIPAIFLASSDHSEGAISLFFYEHCKKCGQRRKRITFDFVDMLCVTARRWLCEKCKDPDTNLENAVDYDDESNIEHHFSDTSGIIGSTFEECSKLITRGARINELWAFYCHITNELLQSLRFLLDSSNGIVINPSGWESSESFKNLLLEHKELMWFVMSQRDEAFNLLDDEFFRSAGRGQFHVIVNDDPLPVTDSQLKLIFGRNDLSEVLIIPTSGFTVEGLRQAMQALLFATPKKIYLIMISGFADYSALSKRLEFESVTTELDEEGKMMNCFKYSCGDRRVTVQITAVDYFITLFGAAHEDHTAILISSD